MVDYLEPYPLPNNSVVITTRRRSFPNDDGGNGGGGAVLVLRASELRTTDTRTLHTLASLYGVVRGVVIPRGRGGTVLGHAYVTFADRDDALKAMVALDGVRYRAGVLSVQFAPRQQQAKHQQDRQDNNDNNNNNLRCKRSRSRSPPSRSDSESTTSTSS
eukprot:PhM_4_TR9571/c0_g1_i1/m.94151